MQCCCWVIGPHTIDVGFHIHVGDEYYVFNYSWWLWCSVGIRGDDLGGDLVPHVSRVGLGTLHVRMSHNCLCAWCELRVCHCCVLGDYLWLMNHMLVENCWWQFGEYLKCTYVNVYEPWDILMIDYSCLYILIMIDVKLTPSGQWWSPTYLYEWVDGMQD